MHNKQFLLPKINSPNDIKRLKRKELEQLAEEIRKQIVNTVSNNGGHLASNLGVVELSIALHRVFNSPQDKIVWDVGHQCYAHKLLTGRYAQFNTLRKSGGIAGFPKRSESPHDAFNTGHASTSISAALGLLAAEKITGGQGHAIAVIGDGALTGGLAYEALSHAGHLALPLIVVLNDNKMSISPNVGGLSKYLSRLSMKEKYQTFRRHFDAMAKKIPFVGNAFFSIVLRLKRAVKAVFYIDNFFVDLGFEYVGPIGGHNILSLINILEDVKKINRPTVIHVITRKGKGYSFAEDEPDSYHGVPSFLIDSRLSNTKSVTVQNSINKITFTEAFSKAITAVALNDKRVTALTAAMQAGTGLSSFKREFPDRFFDVGIAEEHALTFAAGLAVSGLKPIVAVYSTFIQRAVDQIIHDIALQKLPVIIALDRAGFVGDDGETHQGLFDIALFRSVPNITILCPASEKELCLMLNWALEQETETVIIRYPKAYCPAEARGDETQNNETLPFSAPIEKGRGIWLKKNTGAKACIAFTGSLYTEAAKAAVILRESGIEADLYNLRFIKPIDENYLVSLMNSYELTVFAEEGIKEGGFGEYAASLALQHNCKSRIEIFAAGSSFLVEDKALGTREELLALNGLDGKSIADRIRQSLNYPTTFRTDQ